MKRKVLCVALSLTLCSSMVLQVGAAAVNTQPEELASEITEETLDQEELTETSEDMEDTEETEAVQDTEDTQETGDTEETPEEQEAEDTVLTDDADGASAEDSENKEDGSAEEKDETTQIETKGVVHTHLIESKGIMPADQVEWVQEENGGYRLYCHADSCENAYFTADDGIIGIQNGESTFYYYFDQNGYMVTGEAKIQASETGLPKEDGTYYFLGAGEDNSSEVIEKNELMTLDAEESPETSLVGTIQTDKWVWQNDKWNYYDETSGKRLTLEELAARQADPGNTIFLIGGKYYALADDCVPQTGRFTAANPYNGIESYFYGSEEETADGHKGYLMKGWVYLPTKVSSGAIASRYQYFGLSLSGEELKKQTDGQYYEGAEYMWNQTMYELRQIESCVNAPDRDMGEDPWYFLTKNGYVEHDKLVVGTFNRPGKYYGVDNKGHLYRSTLAKVKNSSGKVRAYCFSASGVRCNYRNGWYMVPDTKDWYYFDNTYARYIKTGWQSIDLPNDPDRVCWAYYYKSGANKGKMKKNGWQGSRYIKPNGVMAMGVYKVGNTLYYFKPATKTKCYGTMVKDGWITSGSKKYYAYPSGKLYRGWHTIGGKIYYFIYEDGSMMKNQSRQYTGSNSKYKGKWGYADSTGAWQTGWVKTYLGEKEGDGFRYIDPTTGKFVKNQWKTIDGMKFHFKADGWLKLDVTDEIKGPYYVTVNRTTCVMTIYNKSGDTPVKAIRVSVGKPETPTPTGTYTLSRAGRWQLLMGPSYGQYASHVVGAGQGGIFIHSVAGSAPNSYSLPAAEFDLLGQPASHGCIRTCVRDALWVWNNCNGAKIKIGDNLKDPFGKPGWIWIPGSQNYDPTDPAVQ